MYQLLLCANSALNTVGQFSFLKRASTSCTTKRKDCQWAMTYQLQHKNPQSFKISNFQHRQAHSDSSVHNKSYVQLLLHYVVQKIYLNWCSLRYFSQNNDAATVVWSNFLPSFIHLYHGRSCHKHQTLIQATSHSGIKLRAHITLTLYFYTTYNCSIYQSYSKHYKCVNVHHCHKKLH